jgi:4-amino-4-deoxy-L-arabinose transferase-like glycosyltransferase
LTFLLPADYGTLFYLQNGDVVVGGARIVLAKHPRAEWLIPAALCLILLAQMLFSVRQMSQHTDEATHLYAGYRALKCGDYTFGREHPPLAKMLASAPLLWSNPPLDCTRGSVGEDEEEKATIWLYSQQGWWRLLMEARAASSLFAVALCLGVWITARRMFGRAVAAVSTAALAFEPNILGHGALLLNDTLLTALFLLTVFSFYLWTRQRSVWLLVSTGLLAGLALLTKYSAVLLIPMLILLALAEAWLETNDKKEAAARTWRNFKAAAAILVIAAAPIWCAYGMRYSGGTREFEEQRASTESANVRVAQVLCSAHLLPKDYLQGFIEVRGLVGTTGDGSYFLGRPYLQAPWYWFPVTMTIKFTLAFLAMLAMGAAEFLAVGRKWRREILFLLLPPVLYLAASMSIQRTGVGIWHLFPMFPFLVIAAAAGCVSLARRYHWVGGILVCLLVLHAASSLRAYPNYLSYANEAWGGPRNLFKHLPWTDLNQTYWQISRYMEQHPNSPCWVSGEWRVPASAYKVPCTQMGNYFETELPDRMEGIVFISGSWLALWGHPGGPYSPFYASEPKARLGGSAMLVYEGEFDTRVAAARALDNKANRLLKAGKHAAALLPAREAVEVSQSTATAHDIYCLALLYNGHPQQALGECAVAQTLALPDMEGQRLAKGFAHNLEVVTRLNQMRPSAAR